MRMANQMSKFSPNIAHISKPLRELMSSKIVWTWNTAHANAFKAMQDEISSPWVLALYSTTVKTKVSADASAYAVLLQQQDKDWRLVSFASRALSEMETWYAQIEKEALALTWAMEKFAKFFSGKEIILETDHKPLVPLLEKKSLDLLPPRVLRFRLRLAKFQYTIHHVLGKTLYTADMLSRAPSQELNRDISHLSTEVELFVDAITAALPASPSRLDSYIRAQAADQVCSKLIEYCQSGRNQLSREMKRLLEILWRPYPQW